MISSTSLKNRLIFSWFKLVESNDDLVKVIINSKIPGFGLGFDLNECGLLHTDETPDRCHSLIWGAYVREEAEGDTSG
jgi:hypothetical protein